MGTPEKAAEFLKAMIGARDASCRPAQFDATALEGLHSIEAERGKITCLLPTPPRVLNRYGTLHGGCIATLVDTVGTAALVTQTTRSGMSLSINVNYLAPMAADGTARVEAEVIREGKTIATIEVRVLNEAGKLVAKGTHVKYLRPILTSSL